LQTGNKKKTLSKDEIAELFDDYFESRDPVVRGRLIEAHNHMISFFVNRFASGSDISEDIAQVATVGLINAVDRFDPSRNVEFTTFATVTIMGEIKRFFRDKTWSVKVPRRIKDLNVMINHTIEKLSVELDRQPTIDEIAKSIGCTAEDIIEANEAVQSYHVVSLDKEIDNESGDNTTTLADLIGSIDRKIDNLSDRLSLQSGFKQLKEEERIVIFNRFFGNMSQAEVAKMMKVSQMQISRIQSSALKKLKTILSR